MSANQLAPEAAGNLSATATGQATASQATSYYDDYAVRNFTIMAVVWGVVGMLMGVIIASQLAFPELNLGIAETSFGRLRPLHTNLVILRLVAVHYLPPLTTLCSAPVKSGCNFRSFHATPFGVIKR